jgi:hypothetical protein
MTPERFRELAVEAFADASEYLELAHQSDGERRERLLKYASNRQSDGTFYQGRAYLIEHSRVMQ